MKKLILLLFFIPLLTNAQITKGVFGNNNTLDNVAKTNPGHTTNKWTKLAELTINGNYSPAGITVDFFPKNPNHGDSRQQLNVQFRNNHGTAIQSGYDINLVNFYGAQKTIKDVKVVHTSGSGVTNNKLSVWVQIGISWLSNVPIEVRKYGAVSFETTNQPCFTNIPETGKVYDLMAHHTMIEKTTNGGATKANKLLLPTAGTAGGGKITNPSGKLDIRSDSSWSNSAIIARGTTNQNPVLAWYRPTGTGATAYPWHFEAQSSSFHIKTGSHANIGSETVSPIMTFKSNGNIGIGTTTPGHKLDVAGSARFGVNKGLILYDDPANSVLRSINNHFHLITNRDQDDIYFRTGNSAAFRMTIKGSGNIGIGTTSPKEKLSVNGKIRAKEVKVEITNWPDYVFEKDYQLPSLSDVQKHIATKGHLPNMPSATAIKEQGAALGELNVKLLEKIEELTLYTLDQEAQLQKQQSIIETLNARLSQIESQINKHEKPTP